MLKAIKKLVFIIVKTALPLSLVLSLALPTLVSADPLLEIIGGDHRQEKNVLRDVYRNPHETLSFFGIEPGMTVIESWPGGGWYTEILAPYLKDDGTFIAATYNRDSTTQKAWQARTNKGYDERYVANKDVYGDITVVSFAPETGNAIAKPGSVDMILDFRNAHNWINSEQGSVPAAWHKALKKGGIVGVVDHRMDPKKDYNPKNGYIHEKQLVAVMKKHGFELVDKSEINSNARDSKDHPKGVWTLPPILTMKAEHKNKYLAIGESDRLVMKFKKI